MLMAGDHKQETNMKQKKVGKTPIKKMAIDALRKDLSRCETALRNKSLKPQSEMYYSRRRQTIETELGQRS
jgi:hypothetical protein